MTTNLTGRVTSLLCACLAGITAGSVYCFPLFGPNLASHLKLSFFQANIIATAGDVGLSVSGPISGTLVDKYGPKICCFIASIFLLFGFLGLSMAFTYNINSLWILSGLFFLVGFGGTSAYMSSIRNTVHNWPSNVRGLMVGFPLACYGLSPLLFTFMDYLYFADTINGVPDSVGFLRWTAFTNFVLNIVCTLGMNRYEYIGSTLTEENDDKAPNTASEEILHNYSLKELFMDNNFWKIFFLLGVTSGAGLMYINNLGFIAIALLVSNNAPSHLLPQQIRNRHLAIFAVSSFFSRIIFGALSDLTGRRMRWVAFVNLALCLSFLGLAFTETNNWMQIWTATIGASFGGLFTVVPTIFSEWWGAKNFGRNWGWAGWAPALGSVIFGSMFGLFYDSQGGTNCSGKRCYDKACLVVSFCGVLSLIVCIRLIKIRDA